MMKKLYLHIGTGKTGTSSIQKTFSQRKNNFHFSFDMDGPKHFKDPDAFIKKIQGDGSYEKIVYSNEWSYRADRKTVEKLSLALHKIFNVEVIIYFRRQDEFELSRYQQVGKSGNGKSSSGSIALPIGENRELNYFNIAEKWSEFFSIKVRLFDRDRLIGGDVVVDFANAIGEQVPKNEIITANVSSGIIKTKLGHIINELDLNGIRKYLLAGVPDSPKSLASKQSMMELFNKYDDVNKLLSDKYIENNFTFSRDFSRYPDERQDQWTEDTADKAIKHILKKFKGSCEPNNSQIDHINNILEAALFFESKNILLSYELILIIHRMELDDVLIKEKLDKFRKKLRQQNRYFFKNKLKFLFKFLPQFIFSVFRHRY